MMRVRALASRWTTFAFAPGSATTLGTCRLVFFGVLFLWQLPHDFTPWGAYSEVFWRPVWLFDTLRLPAVSPTTLAWLQAIWKVSLFLSAIGFFSRPAMAVAFALGTYLMGLPHNFGQTQHFDTLVVFVSGALALSRAADACSIDAMIAAAARRTPKRPAISAEYTWPIRFVWIATALIEGLHCSSCTPTRFSSSASSSVLSSPRAARMSGCSATRSSHVRRASAKAFKI